MGYANALSFKNIDDADIDCVQSYIKYDALKNAVAQLEHSVEGDYESVSFCLQDNQMIEIFGDIHASNPSEFKFERGDRIRIRSLVEYVKDVVDGEGKLKGLALFESKRKAKPGNIMPLRKKCMLNTHTEKEAKKSIEQLKSELHHRIVDVLKSNGIDTTDLIDDIVKVEPNGIFGLVDCIICKRNSKRKMNPKRVFYKSRAKSGFWVVANFDSHLKRVHKTSSNGSAAINVEKIKKKNNAKSYTFTSESIDNNALSWIQSNTKPPEEIEKHQIDKLLPAATVSNECVKSEIIDVEIDLTELDESNNNEDEVSYNKQISNQLTKMMSAVLMNGDIQTQMDFRLKNDQVRYLSTVKMNPNGDCLLSALCHQQFCNPANSQQHINDTNRLRADVVAHILKPENFPKFQYTLQNHVYDIKSKAEICDMETECKLYVKNVLSKRGEWGGMEVIKAASEIFECNILIYQEHDSCQIIRSGDKMYDQTLIIAYRYMMTGEGKPKLCHYDSVTDMDPLSILASANALPK